MRAILLIVAVSILPTWSLPVEQTMQWSKLGRQDPEIDMKPEEIIKYWGYDVETYDAQTDDGYILSLYRIPRGRNDTSTAPRPIVFLQHGLECSAVDWIINLPDQSPAFVFADAGFDVWLGNFRGNTYGKRHATVSPKEHAFWQFSFDEMAAFDLPALIDKTLEIAKTTQLYYVGHSMGTMTGFVKFSQDLVFAKKIKQFYAMGPVLSMKNVQGPVKYAAPLTNSMQAMARIFGVDEFLPSNKLQEIWAKFLCPNNPLIDLVCKNPLLMISGPDTHQINESRVPVINAHTPSGTSVQNVVHFGQLVNSGNFQAYDYGSAEANRDRYGTDKPPVYDVSKMETPVAFYSGGSDWVASPIDVSYSVSLFKNVIDNVLLSDFNHMDFLWGVHAAPLIYQPIVESIRKDFSS